ncbi:MAG TPA: DUF819 family protein [Candidatus Omnitrophota bacterium]|nr:DUF819 family protein [Candidatus Omnitrophota bacterium]
MINNTWGIIIVLAGLQTLVMSLAGHRRFARYFTFLPSVFWIYFLPMLASTGGLIDPQHPVYGVITKNILPASLFLLLLGVDIKAIIGLGPKALAMMLCGSAGIMLGTVITFTLFKSIVGEPMWAGFGALSASWIGGSANLVAVKEVLSTPDEVFLPMVIVDTIVPYFWMGILVSAVGLRPLFDRFTGTDPNVLEKFRQNSVSGSSGPGRFSFGMAVMILAIAFAGGFAAINISRYLPEIKDVISTYAWTVILASLFGLAFSLTPARQLEKRGSNRIGYILLYFVLASIGAKASLSNISASFTLIAAGFLIVFIHATVLLVAARLLRAPMFLAAVASQANIGGVASAPIVAEVYQPGLASVGILLAVFGGILGTYLGILTGHLCHLL